MVKDDRHRTRGLLFGGSEVSLPQTGEAFKLITRVQDEAHRFAINYHRSLSDKGMVRSVLDTIEGIGGTRKRALMKHFGSIDNISGAGVEELKNVQGMNEKSAQAVYEFFHRK
jgi:excinuclease ABC subunit C